MRFETHYASNYLVWRLQYAQQVADIRDEGDVLLVTMADGRQIMIYLLERPQSLSDVQHYVRENTAADRHTLLIPWADMLLPGEGPAYQMPDWMVTLSALHGDKIYGYDVAGRQAFFFPVHFTGSGPTRAVRFGDIVDYLALDAFSITTQTPHLTGTWRMAGFDADPTQPAARDHTPMQIYFEVLELAPTDDIEAVKRAYRALARQYHPDVNDSRQALLRMKQINDAYARLQRHLEMD